MNTPFINGVFLPQNKIMDLNGVIVRPGQRVRVFPSRSKSDGTWDGNTQFEDGCLTVSILDVTNVSNPSTWDREHDWIKSRHWGCMVGYGEYGSWNCPRQPITRIAPIRDQELSMTLGDLHGYGNRFVNVQVLGVAMKTDDRGAS